MEQQKVIRRIEKCMALTTSSNPYEAASALRQATMLMAKHNIDYETITLSKVLPAVPKTKFNRRHMARHYSFLCTTVATAFEIRSVLETERVVSNGKVKLIQRPLFYGIGEESEVAAYTFDVLARQLDKERKAFLKTFKGSAAHKTKLGNEFSMGWVVTVAAKVKEFAREGGDPTKSQILERWANKQWNGVAPAVKTRKRTLSKQQHYARVLGQERASDVQLFHATTHNGQEQEKLEDHSQ